MINFLRQFFNFFKRKPPSTMIIKREKLPEPPFEGRKIIIPPIQLESAVTEDNNVGHIDFNKVRKITKRYKKKTGRHNEFYDDDGGLILK